MRDGTGVKSCPGHVVPARSHGKMADGANNRSIIVYKPATKSISIKKIRDLGRFFRHSFSHLFFIVLELRIARNEPSHHPANTQIQIPCEDQNREFRA